MLWDQCLSDNAPLNEDFAFSPSYIQFHEHPTVGYVGWVTLRPPKKTERLVSPALASLKAELVKRREAGAFENNESLADRWTKQDLDIDDNELASGLKEIRTMWEQDLDNLLDEG